MKDLLAFLFKVKKEAAAGESTAQETTDNLQPVLEAVASAKGVSHNALLASVLCDYLLQHKDDIDATVMDTVAVTKRTSADMKSGALDKVNDDCLALALRFLDFRDRCNGSELVCHRLFQLSRALPIHCFRFDRIWKRGMDTLRVARRFRTRVFCCHWLPQLGTTTAVAVAAFFRDCVTQLWLASPPIVDTTFPNLKCIQVRDSVETLRQALANNPSADSVRFFRSIAEAPIVSQLLQCLSELKQISKLKLDVDDRFVPVSNDLDFSHVKELQLVGSGNFLPHFVHCKSLHLDCCDLSATSWSVVAEVCSEGMYPPCVGQIEIEGEQMEEPMYAAGVIPTDVLLAEVLASERRAPGRFAAETLSARNTLPIGPKPTALRFLALVNCRGFGGQMAENLQFFDECKLERVQIDADLTLLSQICRQLSATHLLYTVTAVGSDEHMAVCLQSLAQSLSRERLRSLELVFTQRRVPVDKRTALTGFFTQLSQVPTAINVCVTLRIYKQMLAEIMEEIDAEFIGAFVRRVRVEYIRRRHR